MIYSTQETISEAVHTFYLDREGKPELIPLGFSKLDGELGGLGPRACAILAAATGVGKSSAMLSAMLSSRVTVGCVSLEDGPDVIGTRLLSAISGIDSLRIRRKDLTDDDLQTMSPVVPVSSDLLQIIKPHHLTPNTCECINRCFHVIYGTCCWVCEIHMIGSTGSPYGLEVIVC